LDHGQSSIDTYISPILAKHILKYSLLLWDVSPKMGDAYLKGNLFMFVKSCLDMYANNDPLDMYHPVDNPQITRSSALIIPKIHVPLRQKGVLGVLCDGDLDLRENGGFNNMIYPLVNIQKAIENGDL